MDNNKVYVQKTKNNINIVCDFSSFFQNFINILYVLSSF